MNLEHVAISIISVDEIVNFYQNILGMKHLRDFILNKNLAFDIFGINTDIPVYLLNKGNVTIEIFVVGQASCEKVNHICFSMKDREMIYQKALEKKYECIKIERDSSDLIFIKDKSGNIFEIKEK